jgi:hypothetical protein
MNKSRPSLQRVDRNSQKSWEVSPATFQGKKTLRFEQNLGSATREDEQLVEDRNNKVLYLKCLKEEYETQRRVHQRLERETKKNAGNMQEIHEYTTKRDYRSLQDLNKEFGNLQHHIMDRFALGKSAFSEDS